MNAILFGLHKRAIELQDIEKTANESLDLLSLSGSAMAEAITLETGDKSPLFDALDSKGERHNLTDLISSGNKVILYFYRDALDAPWYMRLEDSLRVAEADKDKKH